MAKRPVIVHFHLFKNAGTSVDRILQDNFAKREWAEIEGPNRKKLDTVDLVEFIRSKKALKAVSSHTAVVSVPELDDIEIIPILFLRHPIDRIRSAYDFEKKQVADTPGAKFAKKGSFEDYMEWRLTQPTKAQVSNFHAARLKDFHKITPYRKTNLYLSRAKAAVDALPFVGIVEEFDQSMHKFEAIIAKHFSNFKAGSTRENVTAPTDHSLQDNIKAFKQRIGPSVFEKLKDLNDVDFELYRYAKKRFLSQTG